MPTYTEQVNFTREVTVSNDDLLLQLSREERNTPGGRQRATRIVMQYRRTNEAGALEEKQVNGFLEDLNGLTDQERSDLLSLLVKVRDAVFAAEGLTKQ